MSRFFSLVALEVLESQSSAILRATESGFIDDTVAAGFDVVHATADLVVATNLDFLGRVGSRVALASPFVLEGFLSLDPRASESAFDDFSAFVTLGACNGADFGFSIFDDAFVDDISFGEAIAVIDVLSIVHATGGLDSELLTTSTGAGEKEPARFERLSSAVCFSLFHATTGHQTSAVVDGSVASELEVVLGDLIVQSDTSALIDATSNDHFQVIVISLLAGVEVAAVFKFFIELVFHTLVEASNRIDGQRAVAAQGAFKTVFFSVDRATNWDLFQIIGHACLRHDIAILTFVYAATAFKLGAIG